jgi:hypothetical protein
MGRSVSFVASGSFCIVPAKPHDLGHLIKHFQFAIGLNQTGRAVAMGVPGWIWEMTVGDNSPCPFKFRGI